MRRTFTIQLYDQPALRPVASIIAELATATGTDEREVSAAIHDIIMADNAAKNAATNLGLQRAPGELDISFRSRVLEAMGGAANSPLATSVIEAFETEQRRIEQQVANMVLGPPDKSKAQSLTEAMRSGGVPATPEQEESKAELMKRLLEMKF